MLGRYGGPVMGFRPCLLRRIRHRDVRRVSIALQIRREGREASHDDVGARQVDRWAPYFFIWTP